MSKVTTTTKSVKYTPVARSTGLQSGRTSKKGRKSGNRGKQGTNFPVVRETIIHTNRPRRYYNSRVTNNNSLIISGIDKVYTEFDELDESGLFCVIPLNPNCWEGSRVAHTAKAYQNFRPLKIIMHYTPSVGTTNNGTIWYGTTSGNSPPSTGKLENSLFTSNGGGISQIAIPKHIPIRLGKNLQQRLFSTRVDVTPEGLPMTFFCFVKGFDQVPGVWTVEYKFEFRNPISDDQPFQTSQLDSAANVEKQFAKFPNNSAMLITSVDAKVLETQYVNHTPISGSQTIALYAGTYLRYEAGTYFYNDTPVTIPKTTKMIGFSYGVLTETEPEPITEIAADFSDYNSTDLNATLELPPGSSVFYLTEPDDQNYQIVKVHNPYDITMELPAEERVQPVANGLGQLIWKYATKTLDNIFLSEKPDEKFVNLTPKAAAGLLAKKAIGFMFTRILPKIVQGLAQNFILPVAGNVSNDESELSTAVNVTLKNPALPLSLKKWTNVGRTLNLGAYTKAYVLRVDSNGVGYSYIETKANGVIRTAPVGANYYTWNDSTTMPLLYATPSGLQTTADYVEFTANLSSETFLVADGDQSILPEEHAIMLIDTQWNHDDQHGYVIATLKNQFQVQFVTTKIMHEQLLSSTDFDSTYNVYYTSEDQIAKMLLMPKTWNWSNLPVPLFTPMNMFSTYLINPPQ